MRKFWRRVVLVVGCLLVGACTSAGFEEMLELHPELTDLQLEGAERTSRFAHSSLGGPHASTSEVSQRFVPSDEGANHEDLVEDAVALAESLGWEIVYLDGNEWWTGCRPSPSLPDIGYRLRIHIVDASTDLESPRSVGVQLAAGRKCRT